MLIANFFHIKATNGLFYYGLDYVHALKHRPSHILVRPSMAAVLRNHFPTIPVVACTGTRYLLEVLKAIRAGETLFTPSSHPLPFLSRQFVVLHDTYPFLGRSGRIKRFLFVLSARSSHCHLAYINHSASLAFFRNCGFDKERLVFAPNSFTVRMPRLERNRKNCEKRLIVGLVGTDSSKKNYGSLFAAVRNDGREGSITFQTYGHSTDYFCSVQAAFPEIDLQLVPSDQRSVFSFLGQIDALVSVAENEGFGRPIASALQAGVPCYLLETPVFLEFFSGGAQFFQDIPSLLKHLLETWSGPGLPNVSFHPPAHVIEGFVEAVTLLDKLSLPSEVADS
jgi:glycosyltransferase involved in cell wall biosynthesis